MTNLEKTPAESRLLAMLRTLWWPFVVISLLAFVVSACAQLTTARDYVAKGTAKTIANECLLSSTARAGNLEAVNAQLQADGNLARALALDCNGDGAPDF